MKKTTTLLIIMFSIIMSSSAVPDSTGMAFKTLEKQTIKIRQKSQNKETQLTHSGERATAIMPSMRGMVIIPNDTLRIVLENNSTNPMKFYPMTVFDSDTELVMYDKQSFIQKLQTMNQIEVLKYLAKIYKSPYFINDYIEAANYNMPGEYLEKYYAFISSIVSVTHRQCGDYWHQAFLEMLEAEIFSADSMMRVGCYAHQLGQVISEGDTILSDFDPAEPRWLDTINGGYYSATDMTNYGHLLHDSTRYQYCYAEDECFYLGHPDTEHHVRYFTDSAVVLYPEYVHETADIPGYWILPPSSNFTFEYFMPKYFVLWDITKDSLFNEASILWNSGDTTAAINLVEIILGLPAQEAMWALNTGNVFAYEDSPTFGQYFELFNYEMLTAKLLVNTTHSCTFGSDITLPYRIHSINASSPIMLDDTTASLFKVEMYNKKKEDSTSAPIIGAKDLQFIAGSGSIPANTNVAFELYINQRVYSIPDGIEVVVMEGEAPLVSVTSQKNPTLLSDATVLDGSIIIYPNPANDLVSIQTEIRPKTIEVVNVLGVRVLTTRDIQNIDISHLPNGTYFLQFQFANNQKVLKKLIVAH